jgi:prepilin-type processing-associated H-X9-DG protein
MNANMSYLDGNVAGGELSRIFNADLTAAEGQCANCGATRRFADFHLYVDCPGLVAPL